MEEQKRQQQDRTEGTAGTHKESSGTQQRQQQETFGNARNTGETAAETTAGQNRGNNRKQKET